MIGVVGSIFAAMIAASAVATLARHRGIFVEIGVAAILAGSTALMSLAPAIEVLAFWTIGAIPAVILAMVCCIPVFLIARGATQLLERQGTDRVEPALASLTRLMGITILTLSYVGIVGIFIITWERYPG